MLRSLSVVSTRYASSADHTYKPLVEQESDSNRSNSQGTLQTLTGQKAVTLYLGDGNAAPGVRGDMIGLLLHSYIPRLVCNKHLEDYPVVFSGAEGLNAFLKLRHECCSTASPEMTASKANVPVIRAAAKYVLMKVPVCLAQDFSFQENLKIYIDGHCSEGLDALVLDQKKLSMDAVAKVLVGIGVPKAIKDIRLTGCSSADAGRVEDLSVDDLEEYSEQHTHEGRLYKAPAEYLLNALNSHGFETVAVTGYHGLGALEDGSRLFDHALRVSKPEYYSANSMLTYYRRSTVAHRFVRGY